MKKLLTIASLFYLSTFASPLLSFNQVESFLHGFALGVQLGLGQRLIEKGLNYCLPKQNTDLGSLFISLSFATPYVAKELSVKRNAAPSTFLYNV